VDILLPVWGRAYIDNCLSLCLRALLAPGNLPAMAASLPVSLTMLTQDEEVAAIAAHPVAAAIRRFAELRFIAIDDLIADGSYGVVLTLALRRGMQRNDRCLQTHFILMMSDLILADGALRRLAEEIRAGRSAIFAPGWRAEEEALGPRLRQWSQTEPLSIAPRTLAGMTLAELHPTVVARTVDQQLCSTCHPNQLYWRHGSGTLLCRQMLMHLFCIRPERLLGAATSFFDYGLALEAAPSGDIAILGDSNEFMALELQRRDGEAAMLSWGGLTVPHVAADAAAWTTPIHRRLFQATCILRGEDAGDVPDTVWSAIDAYASAVLAALPPPQPAEGHPFWSGAVQGWLGQLAARGIEPPLAEFGLHGKVRGRRSLRARLTERLIRFAFGREPMLTPLHPRWSKLRLIRRRAEPWASCRGDLLVVSASDDLGQLFPTGRRVRLDALADLAPGQLFGRVIVDAALPSLRGVLAVLDDRPDFLAEDGDIVFLFRNEEDLTVARQATHVLKLLEQHRLECLETEVGGNPVGNAASLIGSSVARDLWHGGFRKLAGVVLTGGVAVLLSLLSALVEVVLVEGRGMQAGCSVMALRCRRRAPDSTPVVEPALQHQNIP
jgi:hypothetical protein